MWVGREEIKCLRGGTPLHTRCGESNVEARLLMVGAVNQTFAQGTSSMKAHDATCMIPSKGHSAARATESFIAHSPMIPRYPLAPLDTPLHIRISRAT